MARRVWKDPFITISAVDLSSECLGITPNRDLVVVDDEVPNSQTQFLAGTDKLWFEAEFAQDYAAGKLDATVRPLHGTAVAVAIRQNKTAAISTTNPEYQATCIIDYRTPLGGRMNEKETAIVRFYPTTQWTVDITP